MSEEKDTGMLFPAVCGLASVFLALPLSIYNYYPANTNTSTKRWQQLSAHARSVITRSCVDTNRQNADQLSQTTL